MEAAGDPRCARPAGLAVYAPAGDGSGRRPSLHTSEGVLHPDLNISYRYHLSQKCLGRPQNAQNHCFPVLTLDLPKSEKHLRTLKTTLALKICTLHTREGVIHPDMSILYPYHLSQKCLERPQNA